MLVVNWLYINNQIELNSISFTDIEVKLGAAVTEGRPQLTKSKRRLTEEIKNDIFLSGCFRMITDIITNQRMCFMSPEQS